MKLKKSLPLKDFKRNVGHSNHMLVTMFVALEHIIQCDCLYENSLNANWNPKCKNSSIERAKVYAKNSALIFVVDNIDTYLNKVNCIFLDIINKTAQDNFNKKIRSIYSKLELVNKHFGNKSVEYIFVQILIKWRNKKAHSSSKSSLDQKFKKKLLKNRSLIAEKYRGLDVDKMIKSFEDTNNNPTFKEITSLISASINYIELLDSNIIKSACSKKIAERIILYCYSENKKSILGLNSEKREKKFIQQLKQYGYTNEENDIEIARHCNELSHMSKNELDTLLKEQEGFFKNMNLCNVDFI